jgi:hypothetical protein
MDKKNTENDSPNDCLYHGPEDIIIIILLDKQLLSFVRLFTYTVYCTHTYIISPLSEWRVLQLRIRDQICYYYYSYIHHKDEQSTGTLHLLLLLPVIHINAQL